MDDFIKGLQQLQALSSVRLDEQVARQAVAGHQFSMQYMNMGFARDAFEMSVVEGHAMQGLTMSMLPAHAAGMQLADRVPVPKPGTV